MQCPACGNPTQGAFCSRCGAAIAPPASTGAIPGPYAPIASGYPPPPAIFAGRVQRHLQPLAIVWFVYGAFTALGGLIGAFVLAGISAQGALGNWSMPPQFPFGGGAGWMAGLAGFVAVITLIFAALSLVTGYALLKRKPWGRTLAIIAGILQLIKIPFGTALGIYTLWVLAPSLSGAEYESIADHS